jgi:hypothetical protein
MAGMSSVRRHLGQWISVRAHAERTPPRLTITFTLGELPDGWARSRGHARTWAGLFGLVCIAPFLLLLAATLLRGVGVGQPYGWISSSEIAILAATLSLFIGIPVAIAVNLWRIGRIGMRRRDGALEGLVALELAPLHLFVVATALAVGGLFVGHLAADSYACLNGVRSAC